MQATDQQDITSDANKSIAKTQSTLSPKKQAESDGPESKNVLANIVQSTEGTSSKGKSGDRPTELYGADSIFEIVTANMTWSKDVDSLSRSVDIMVVDIMQIFLFPRKTWSDKADPSNAVPVSETLSDSTDTQSCAGKVLARDGSTDSYNVVHITGIPNSMDGQVSHNSGNSLSVDEGPDFVYTVASNTQTGTDLTHHVGNDTWVSTW